MRRGLAITPARTTGSIRTFGAGLDGAPTRPATPALSASAGGPPGPLVEVVAVVVVRHIGTGRVRARLRVRIGLLRMGAELFDGGAAPRAGKGAVEVPSARVAVVHDAGRVSSAPVTFIGTAVNVV
jgi:hypothetical protein